MATLDLTLKHRWFDKIKHGEKKEEYREITDYWHRRLTEGEYGAFRKFDAVRFHKGYTNETVTMEWKGMTIGQGDPRLGAPEDRPVYIIKLGDRIQ